jgi:thioredoxin 1
MEHIFTDANFEAEVLKSAQPVLVDFFATWCGPCKMQGPIVDELASEVGDKFKVGKLDIDQGQETASKYGIMSVPSLVIFKDGQVKETLVGLQTKEALRTALEKVA